MTTAEAPVVTKPTSGGGDDYCCCCNVPPCNGKPACGTSGSPNCCALNLNTSRGIIAVLALAMAGHFAGTITWALVQMFPMFGITMFRSAFNGTSAGQIALTFVFPLLKWTSFAVFGLQYMAAAVNRGGPGLVMFFISLFGGGGDVALLLGWGGYVSNADSYQMYGLLVREIMWSGIVCVLFWKMFRGVFKFACGATAVTPNTGESLQDAEARVARSIVKESVEGRGRSVSAAARTRSRSAGSGGGRRSRTRSRSNGPGAASGDTSRLTSSAV